MTPALAREIHRLRTLLTRRTRDARLQRARAERWRTRALAAEWANKNHHERTRP